MPEQDGTDLINEVLELVRGKFGLEDFDGGRVFLMRLHSKIDVTKGDHSKSGAGLSNPVFEQPPADLVCETLNVLL